MGRLLLKCGASGSESYGSGFLVAEFLGAKKVYTVSSIRDHIIPKSLKRTNSRPHLKSRMRQALEPRSHQPLRSKPTTDVSDFEACTF